MQPTPTQELRRPKISIVGMGNVGSTLAYGLAIRGLVGKLSLISHTPDKAVANELDLNHGLCFLPHVIIQAGDYSAASGSDVVVITADAFKGKLKSRLDLAKSNADMLKGMIPELAKAAPKAIYILVTNPVDVMTYLTLKIGGFEPEQVISTGTVLDTARLRYIIAKKCGVSAHDVQGYVIGEHGDSEFIAWSTVTIGSRSVDEYYRTYTQGEKKLDKEAITHEVKTVGHEIYAVKGTTTFAICESIIRVVDAIMRDANSVLTVSRLIDDYLGVGDVSLSVPALVNRKGAAVLPPLALNDEETAAFRNSGDIIRGVIRDLGY